MENNVSHRAFAHSNRGLTPLRRGRRVISVHSHAGTESSSPEIGTARPLAATLSRMPMRSTTWCTTSLETRPMPKISYRRRTGVQFRRWIASHLGPTPPGVAVPTTGAKSRRPSIDLAHPTLRRLRILTHGHVRAPFTHRNGVPADSFRAGPLATGTSDRPWRSHG